jgi:predicted RNase H-like HicB family nuclease
MTNMKKLKVIVCKTPSGISAHLPEVEGYVIARDSAAKLKRDLRAGLQFHIEGLYPEERQQWMEEEYDFEYVFGDIPSLLEACSGN